MVLACFEYATPMGYGFASSVEINQGRLETMLNGAVFHSFHVYDQVPRRELGIHSSGCVLFSSLRSSSKRLIALPRHLQQASIETEISRQSGQVRWPHGKHFTLKRGNSGRLLIYAYGGCNYRHELSLPIESHAASFMGDSISVVLLAGRFFVEKNGSDPHLGQAHQKES